MSYFQDVVTEYLRADRAMFVNTECLIQLQPGDAVSKGTHWFCDAVAVNFRESKVYLCEVTYSETLSALFGRLQAWNAHWAPVCEALRRDSKVPTEFAIQPWVFIPESRRPAFDAKLAALRASTGFSLPTPQVTYLESVVPWLHQTWDRKSVALAVEPGEREPASAAPTLAVE